MCVFVGDGWSMGKGQYRKRLAKSVAVEPRENFGSSKGKGMFRGNLSYIHIDKGHIYHITIYFPIYVLNYIVDMSLQASS